MAAATHSIPAFSGESGAGAPVAGVARWAGGPGVGLADFACAWWRTPSLDRLGAQFHARQVLLTHLGRVAIAQACKLWGLAAGDEVLVPAYNCGVELDALRYCGLNVRFYRIDRQGALDPDSIRGQLTPRTRVVYVIHYFGWPQRLRELHAWCVAKGLRLLEDCALALFSEGPEGPLGTLGDAAIFSFPKSLPVPDGGALVMPKGMSDGGVRLRPASLRRVLRRCLPLLKNGMLGGSVGRLRAGRRHRAEMDVDGARRVDMPADYYFDPRLAERGASRLTGGLLASVEPASVVARRRANYEQLSRALAEVPGVTRLFAELPAGVCPLMLPIRMVARNEAYRRLVERDVAAVPWWAGYHREFSWADFPEAAELKDQVVALPIHQQLQPEHIAYVAACVKAVAEELGGEVHNRSAPCKVRA